MKESRRGGGGGALGIDFCLMIETHAQGDIKNSSDRSSACCPGLTHELCDVGSSQYPSNPV